MTDESTILQGGALGASYNRHLSNPDALEADPDQSVKDYALSDLRIGGVVLSPWNPDTDKFLQADGGVANPLLYPQLPPAYVFADQTILDKDYQGLAISDAGLMVAVAALDIDSQTSSDGETWAAHAAAVPLATFRPHCLAYGAGVFVLIYTPACDTSPDGITWTSRTIPAAVYVAVGYGGGLFVAIGQAAACATSPDGITWTARTIPAGDYTSVTHGAGKYVAVGAAAVCATSPDGITWTARTIPAGDYTDVVYGNGIYVAVGAAGVCAYSYDGITWVANNFASAGAHIAVDHNQHSFLTIDDTPEAFVSEDGINWLQIATDPSVAVNEIANYGGRWIAVSDGGVVSLTADLELPTLAGDNDWLYWVKVA